MVKIKKKPRLNCPYCGFFHHGKWVLENHIKSCSKRPRRKNIG